MSTTSSPAQAKSAPRFTLDSWAVLIALAAAALIRTGVIHRIPW